MTLRALAQAAGWTARPFATVKATQGDREVWEVNPDWTGCGKFEKPGDLQKDAVRQGTWAPEVRRGQGPDFGTSLMRRPFLTAGAAQARALGRAQKWQVLRLSQGQ